MPVVGTKAAASSQGFGEFAQASSAPVYIESVFSTYLYTGNGNAGLTINNGIDLSGKGGLTWLKKRSAAGDNYLYDTARGASNALVSNTTAAAVSDSALDGFTSTGFTLAGGTLNDTYASWTFRKQPKFFDVVTYTGDGTAGRTVAHNLGSTPGCIIVKATSAANDWLVYHTSLGNTQGMSISSTSAAATSTTYWNNTSPTSTQFTVGTSPRSNENGTTFVAYLFAHNAGGFGLTGTDNVISCGSFTTDSSGNATVNLGYEPQWYLVKRTDGNGAWGMADIMRGMTVQTSGNSTLFANTSGAESTTSSFPPQPNATGFSTTGLSASAPHIYIAIRRGPMKVPTDGTKVFEPVARTGTGATATVSSPNFPVDLAIIRNRPDIQDNKFADRLRGKTLALVSDSTAAEGTDVQGVLGFDLQNGITVGTDTAYNKSATAMVNWLFRRAPGFFDEVCTNGDSSGNLSFTHNLGVSPELVILKSRTGTFSWYVYCSALSQPTKTYGLLDSSFALTPTASTYFAATSTTFTTYTGGWVANNGASVAYLFASCPGVSKVTNFTGNGSTQTINCGFTTGARFVLIKATSTTGNWLVFDTARGMTTSTDPWLALNSTAAESATTGACTTTSVGFTVDESKLTGVNTNGVSYIAFAVA